MGPEGEGTAIDIQDGMLNEARERAGKAGLTNIRFIRTGPGEGKLGRNYIDRAVLVTVPGEIPDRGQPYRRSLERSGPGYPAHRKDYPGSSFPDPRHGQETTV